MKNERFAALYERLIDRRVSADELTKELGSIGDFSDDLIAAIHPKPLVREDAEDALRSLDSHYPKESK